MGLENIQEAIETSRQGAKSDYQEWLRERPKNASDYIDLSNDQVRKLKAVITLLLCFNVDMDIPPDYGDLGSALLDYVERIEKYIDDLRDYLGDYELLLLEKPKPEEPVTV